MNWYYSILGGHTHVRVFMNGEKCGDLVFRNEEFEEIKNQLDRCEYNDAGYGLIDFIEEQAKQI